MRKERIKGFIVGVIVTVLLMNTMVFASETSVFKDIRVMIPNIKIFIDGKIAELKDAKGNKVEPMQYNGTTYLPLRALASIIGKEVVWDPATGNISLNTPVVATPVQPAPAAPTPVQPAPTVPTPVQPAPTPTGVQFVGDRWTATISAKDLPFTVNAKNGMSVTINKIDASTGGVKMNITMTNNSTVSDKGDPMTSTWEFYDGKETLEFVDQDRIFYDVDYLRSGQSITGNVNFSGLSNDTDTIILYGGLWQYINREEIKITYKLK